MELFIFARSDCLLYSNLCWLTAPARDVYRVMMTESLSISRTSYSLIVRVLQWAATKSVSRSISLPTRTMTKRRHGGC